MKFMKAMTFALLVFGVARGQEPRLRLEGDGHACSGRLQVGYGRFYWKSSFATCEGRYQIVDKAEGRWTLRLVHGKRDQVRACSFAIVTLQEDSPDLKLTYPLWVVAGYDSEVNMKAGTVDLSCQLQSSFAVRVPAGDVRR